MAEVRETHTATAPLHSNPTALGGSPRLHAEGEGADRRRAANTPGRETRRLYAGDWAAFETWCVHHGQASLPTAPSALAAYLTAFVGTLSAGALARRVSAVGDMHRRHGCPPPGAAPSVRAVLSAARQAERAAREASHSADRPSRRPPAPSPAQWTRMATACPGNLAGLRDRALLLLIAAGLDREALLGLDRDDVRFPDAGAELVLRVADVEGAKTAVPRTIVLRRAGAGAPCPVRAMDIWLRSSETGFGPVFRRVDRWGNVEHASLSVDGLRRILKRRADVVRRRRFPATIA